jgi:hypothetical protein
MAQDMRISVDFLDHPKVVKLERRLGFDGVKSLLRLWGWCAASRPTGEVGDAEDLEIAARWFGKAGDLAECLLTLGLIEKTEGGFAIHQWAEHNPWVAERESRSEMAREKARKRWQCRADEAEDATAMPGQCHGNATAATSDMLPTQPNPVKKPPAKKPRAETSPSGKKSNGWACWIDACRECGRPDPVPVGADTKASAEMAQFFKEDRAVMLRVFKRYLADPDPFLIKQGHALRLLPGRVNAYRAAVSDVLQVVL